MKRIKLTFFALLIILAGCEQDPTEVKMDQNNATDANSLIVLKENKSLMMNLCATNCPPCGSWGWVMFDEIAEKTKDVSLPLMIYSSNPFAEHFICVESSAIDNHLGVTGYPTFAVNHEMMLSRTGGTVNVVKEKQMIYDTIAIHANKSVTAGAALNFYYFKNSDQIGFSYKMSLFEPEDSANYQLAIYVVEDKVKGYQAGHMDGRDALHPYVLRYGYEGPWGIPFTGLNISGASMTGNGVIPIGTDYSSGLDWDKENIHLYAVIYDVSSPENPFSGNIRFVNASEGKLIVP